MEFTFSKGRIAIGKKFLNPLDEFTIAFVHKLEQAKINHVIVSGYVSILFGRSRTSEDVDIIIERLSRERFSRLWRSLAGYDCLNTDDETSAFEYLTTAHAIRFCEKNRFIPNMELKFPKVDIEAFALEHRIVASVNGIDLRISPLELQIAVKLYLGTEKDIEDASHIYKIFKEHLDLPLLWLFLKKLDVEKTFKEYL